MSQPLANANSKEQGPRPARAGGHRRKIELGKRGIRSKTRIHQTGRTSGGNAFCGGALYAILNNRLYRGEIAHRGAVYAGQQEAIVSPELWDAVQALLAANNQAKRTGVYAKDPSLLAGLLPNPPYRRSV